MKKLFDISWKVLIDAGGLIPILVFTMHVFLSRVLHLYEIWPPIDIPMHFSGGVAIAFFVSRCFQLLPRETIRKSRVVLLELLLIGALTASVAVFWEFAEFSADQLFGSNVQISLANTMKDLAMGVLGSVAFMLIRMRHLNVGTSDLKEITLEWVNGQNA